MPELIYGHNDYLQFEGHAKIINWPVCGGGVMSGVGAGEAGGGGRSLSSRTSSAICSLLAPPASRAARACTHTDSGLTRLADTSRVSTLEYNNYTFE